MDYHIKVPCKTEEISKCRAGDMVYLSGTVYTARDAAHKRMEEALLSGQELPFPLRGSFIYYMGPSPARPGRVIGSAGPTTSSRMDLYTPRLLGLGLAGMIGKGRRSEEVKAAITENGAIYLAATGGAGALISRCIKEAEVIAYEDLGTEAIRRLTVEELPCVVAIDSAGNDLYENI